MNARSPYRAAIAVALLASCRDAAAPSVLARDADALFQTDSLSYALRAEEWFWSGKIAFTFTNSTAKPASFVNCNGQTPLVIQQYTRGEWKNVWGPATADCLSSPITVQPGAVLADTIHVHIVYPGSNAQPSAPRSALVGPLRIEWLSLVHDYNGGQSGFGALLALEQRISNRFTVLPE